MELDYKKLDNYSNEEVEELNKTIENFFDNSQDEKLKEAVAYFYILCSKNEDKLEQMDDDDLFCLKEINWSLLFIWWSEKNKSYINDETLTPEIKDLASKLWDLLSKLK